MLCEETKQLISNYLDDVVSLPMRVAIDEHLGECPVCRAHLAELRHLKQSLRSMARPRLPMDLAQSINEALAIEAGARRLNPRLSFSERVTHWLRPRLMPYTVGSFASVLLFMTVFAALRPHFVALHEAALQSTANNSVIFLSNPGFALDLNQPVNSEDYAASRAPFAEQSPSLNPKGALAALTRSYSLPRHPLDYDEADDMVVVADVFSNGSASLAGVVQAPRDRRMLADFESALRHDAAFVPASFDRRPDTMRVVFSVQKVDVRERNF
ncbi:MAG: putative transrane anti-sigma factor [Acidobacteria bacterium]|nr:putative transrane anti-sigma factor [Acidobacteriota bacterium]